ncbi:MAG: enoyl-CoA hydratase/isomerase family protein [Chelatococcus sp.]|nr:enoyl-CoA hydratase/isomerase family protein [Chelatococcus sp. HY11]MBX3547108.1 enoyl-CoA hydratase/isomerase family protein [Chelatococcus sp.]
MIARPEKLNTMSRGFYPGISRVIGELEGDRSVRVVIVTGAGERAFSAGGDIGSLHELGDDRPQRISEGGDARLSRCRALKPTHHRCRQRTGSWGVAAN